jgi:hypothetical protein
MGSSTGQSCVADARLTKSEIPWGKSEFRSGVKECEKWQSKNQEREDQRAEAVAVER